MIKVIRFNQETSHLLRHFLTPKIKHHYYPQIRQTHQELLWRAFCYMILHKLVHVVGGSSAV